jgi:hypothetical protein
MKYSPPVSHLLTYSDFHEEDSLNWPDYLGLGLSKEDIPELIQILDDEELYPPDEEVDEYWPAIHAWRALAQLEATEAIEPLSRVIARLDNPDEDYAEWIMDEMPMVFQQIGTESIPFLANYLRDGSHGQTSHITVVEILQIFAEFYPETRDFCISLFTEQLSRFDANLKDVNGFIVVSLAELKALDTAATIEEAFEKGCVSERVGGNWEDIQVLMGLKPPKQDLSPIRPIFLRSPTSSFDEFGTRERQVQGQSKKKKHQQKESRRQNRGKKKK